MIFIDKAIIGRRQAHAGSVDELRSPAARHLAFRSEVLEGQFVLLCLSVEVWLEVLVIREGVVLQVMAEAQGRAQRVKSERPFLVAQPLPTSMDSFTVQDVVRRQEEPRSQESKEGLELALAMPQDHRRVLL